MQVFESSVELPVSIEQAFAYHERDGALNRLIPPWESVAIESSDGSIKPGSRVTLVMRVLGVPFRWRAEHGTYDPPNRFEDRSLAGPFAYWHHRHIFQSLGPQQTRLIDRVDYKVPLGTFGQAIGGAFVRRQLATMFNYRHRVTRDDLTMMAQNPMPPMTIGVTGSNGLVGNELVNLLSLMGHQVFRAKRNGSGASTTFSLDRPNGWNDCDIVIHLAGKSIAEQRWSPRVKDELRDSRVTPTRTLCETLASQPKPPKAFLCASATGIYGNRGDEILTEQSQLGSDFLAEIAKDWEAACEPARNARIRTVNLRFGIVVSPRGGALAKMLTPAKWGLGGSIGSGNQWWSWLSIDDLLGIVYHIIANDSIEGPINCVSPNAVTSSEFSKTLGGVLRRPSFMSLPSPAVRLALGEMADALLLASSRVQPLRLLQSGYLFRHPQLADTLQDLLGQVELVPIS